MLGKSQKSTFSFMAKLLCISECLNQIVRGLILCRNAVSTVLKVNDYIIPNTTDVTCYKLQIRAKVFLNGVSKTDWQSWL